MKILTIISLLFSCQIFGQYDGITSNKKLESYKYLDSINTYSKSFPTKLIEGSGIIKNKRKKIIGSIGFETYISRNINGKLIRVFESDVHFLKKTKMNPEKTIVYQTTIYFNENQMADLAKIYEEEKIEEKVIISKVHYFDIERIDFNKSNLDFYENKIKGLLIETNQ